MNTDELLDSYDFELPSELIAQRPSAERSESRLMLLDADAPLSHHVFSELPNLLPKDCVLVRNNTKVIPARLLGTRPAGGKCEVLLVHDLTDNDELPEISLSDLPTSGVNWYCLVKPSAKMRPQTALTFNGLNAEVVANLGQGRAVINFNIEQKDFWQAVDKAGEIPLPPYIQREQGPDADDINRYQTTFAGPPGAVAAPTAGLHFTNDVDRELAEKGVEILTVTLHVGPGTFRPIKSDTLSGHDMDYEYYEISDDVAAKLNAARAAGKKIIAVGTTSTRVLESVADDRIFHAGSGWTNIFIKPGYRFVGIDGLITNFHLPKSSLLALVSALKGRGRILNAYAEAVREKYRFYSYGDAMLLV